MTTRQMIAVGLMFAAYQLYLKQDTAPQPDNPAGLNLKGKFVGPDAAEDAAALSGLASELANEIEWDGLQDNPFLQTGVDLDTLRTRAREIRCRGESLGEKHPKVRTAVSTYLNETVGTSGGPISPAERANWVEAYRQIAGAAANASR